MFNLEFVIVMIPYWETTIVSQYREGMNITEIAEQRNISRYIVRRILRKWGVVPKQVLNE